jgi:hypothetical protein
MSFAPFCFSFIEDTIYEKRTTGITHPLLLCMQLEFFLLLRVRVGARTGCGEEMEKMYRFAAVLFQDCHGHQTNSIQIYRSKFSDETLIEGFTVMNML